MSRRPLVHARLAEPPARRVNTGELASLLEEVFLTAGWKEWQARFTETTITFGPIAQPGDHLECGQVAANGFLPEFEDAGGLRTVDSPIRMAGEEKRKPRRAPSLGEHTRTVLADFGFGEDEISRMIECGAAAG